MSTTTLCLIVRNEEANLPACLESVRGLFTEAVIVDTGSTDGTVNVAKRFGARVYRRPWCDDFAAARNAGLDRVRTDYVFRLDADDRLPPGHRKRLARILDQLPASRDVAYACRVHSIEHTGQEVTCDEMRLFPSLPELRFHGRVHERIHIVRDAPHVGLYPSGVRLEHSGYTDAGMYRAKLLRNLRLLDMDAAADPLTLFDLGRTLSALGEHDEALEALRGFLAAPAARYDMARRTTHRRIVEIHRARGDYAGVMAGLEAGLTEFPDDPLLTCWLADVMRHRGELELAREGYEIALRLYDPAKPVSGMAADFRELTTAALETTREAIRATPVRMAPVREPDPGCTSLAALLAM